MSLPANNLELDRIEDAIPEHSYHKHSEEKNIIYFRCSDKKCKARALFNKETSKFTFKSSHLHPSQHKPISTKAIPGQFISKISSLIKGPILLRETSEDSSALVCNETLSFPLKRENSLAEVGVNLLLKFSITSSENAENFCEAVIEKKLAANAVILYNWKKMKISKQNEGRGAVVEVESSEVYKSQIILMAEELFGKINAEVFQKI